MLYKRLILFLVAIILVGCNNKTVEEEMYTYLEEAVRLEDEFVEKQKAINELEVEEQEIYNEIIQLGMDNTDQIIELSQAAIDNINERRDLLTKEKKSIETSQKEFRKTEDILSDIKDKELREKSEKMYNKMNKRYEAYYSLNEAYLTSLSLELELYEMLQREDLKQETLTEHIEKINKSYEKVLKENEMFNQYTVEYNELKKEFYELAGFEITAADGKS